MMPNVFMGKLVRLRAVEPSDWEFFHNWNQETTDEGRMTDEIWFPRSSEGEKAWAEKEAFRGAENDAYRFQIVTLDKVLVGTIDTHSCHLRNGTFGYGLAIHPQHRRKGYASEAIWLVLRHYFHERNYQKCTAAAYSFNEASIRLHEALGFTPEGRLRRMIYTGGEYHDMLYFGMTREEFEAKAWGT
jgi:RimJ/RimL family protein N-acetyltransferase